MNHQTTRPNWVWPILLGISVLTFIAIFSARQATALTPEGGASAGDVVINEIMQNPSAVADGSGEWLELYNTTGAPIDLQNWVISDNDSDSHIIASSVIIPANGYVVLGNNDDSATNGGVTVNYSYGSSWFLSNGADEVVLTDGVTEIDRVEYDNGATFPDPNGASMALIDTTLDNNVGSNWCTASTAYGDGDSGTPGSANDCVSAEAALSVVKEGPATAVAGDTLIYDITIENTGNLDATNVMLTDTLPLSTTFVSSDLGLPAINGNILSWSLGTVSSLASNNYQITVTLTNSVSAGSLLTNTIEISTDAMSDDPVDNTDTAITQIFAPFSGSDEISLNRIGVIGSSGAEIAAHDPLSQTLFVVTGGDFLEVLDITDPTSPTIKYTIPITPYGAGANSVDVYDGLVAVAVEANDPQNNGHVVFFDQDGNYINQILTGALPDMLTFSSDGQTIYVANEGEPNDAYDNDPEGSISVIDVSNGADLAVSSTVLFTHFTTDTLDSSVRIFGPNADVAQDVEPEYIALSADGGTAYIVLQENNAIAILDTQAMTVTDIIGLGFKDHSLDENALDASNQDSGINIQTWPTLGMYQPDAIASYEVNGSTYLVTANEGDARDYAGFSEEFRVRDFDLDDTAFPNEATLIQNENLGRLRTTSANGDIDGDGDYDVLYSYGARSFSIWDENGQLVFDSASDFEDITAVLSPAEFNSQGDPSSFDSRSDDKGPEPEGVALGEINGETYAFIGLERIGGIMVYNISDPIAPYFVQYIPPTTGDISPEGLVFIPHNESPNGKNLLVVAYEVSGTTAIFEINFDADVRVEKTAPAYGVIGEQFTYTVEIANHTSEVASNVLFTDTFPAEVAYINDNSGITPTNIGGNSYVWAIGDVPAETTLTVELSVSVPATLTNNTLLTNTAMISTDSIGDDTSDNVSLSASTFYTMVSIYDIQTVGDPSVDDASPLSGQVVWTEGIVTAEPSEIDSNSRLMYIQDMAGGAWSGLGIFRSSNFPEIYPEGTYVRVLGTVEEAFGATTQLNLSGAPWAVEVMGTTTVPAPETLTTADFSDTDASVSEQWESVFVQFNNATVTDDNLGFGEWHFDDGSGNARADDLGDRDGDLPYAPTNGDMYAFIRGIAGFSFGNYKLFPRYDADIAIVTSAPTFDKTAVDTINPNNLYTYTISLDNTVGFTLTNITVTDTVPAGADFAFSVDGGSYDGSQVTWNLASLAPFTSVEFTFAVTATANSGAIINNDYAIIASNYPTPTFGLPVITTLGNGALPTYAIQGDGVASDLEGATVTTYGIVTGFFEGNSGEGDFDGFFIQDPIGDSDTTTSDGLFVDHGSLNVTVAVGDWVTVTGVVQEYSEYDDSSCPVDEGCLTQVEVNTTGDITIGGTGNVTAVELDPPGDPMLSDLYFESLEGMLVTIPNTATVVGPTSFGTIQVIRGDAGVDRVFHSGPNEGLPVGVRHYEKFGDINGSDPDGLITGSIIENADGPLTFSYGNYLIATQAGDEWLTIFSQPVPTTLPELPAPTETQFSVATFNTLNFDGADNAAKFTKVVEAIDQLNGPTFVALQEINADDVMGTILTDLNNLGYAYDYANSHPDIGNHGVALIWRTDQVSNVSWSADYQGCSEFGSSSSTGYDNYCDGTGLLPTFSRRPVVLTGTVNMMGTDQELVVIANHFKSKLGGFASDQRRLAQAQLVAGIVDDMVANGMNNVIVLGDLNDFEDSPTLEALYDSGNLVTTWDMVPANERYSYIFSGVSQILDHILVTPALYNQLVDVQSLHINADYPFNPFTNDDSTIIRVSDHELVGAIFNAPLPMANLKVAHVAPFGAGDATAVNISLNNTPVLTNVLFGDSTAYMSVVEGDYLVEIFPVGSATPAITASVYLTAEMDFTAVAIGDGTNQPLELLLLEDDIAPSTVGAKLRIGHLAPFADILADTLVAIVDESTGNPIPGLDSVPYKTVSDFLLLPAGTYDLVVTTPDGSMELIDPEPVTVAVGDVLTIFAVGGANGHDLGLLALTGNAGTLADLLPLEADETGYTIFLPFVTNDS